MDITQSYLKSVLHYDHETGLFSRLNGPRMGCVAGTKDNQGYTRIKIGRAGYSAHRLAFLWMTGYLPLDCVDHIDGNKRNNRWHNLRQASKAINSQNRPIPRNNTSGVVGVTWNKRRGRWQATIKINGTPKYLGLYRELWQAKATRKIAERKYGYHPNHGRATE